MADNYLDSGAVVKKYVVEVETAWVLKLVKPSSLNTTYVSRLTSVEVVSAITRRLRAGQISHAAAQRSSIRLERA